MKIHALGAELFHVDIWTDIVKLTFAFLNFVNMPKMRAVVHLLIT
jgi:hypothetical protein